MIFCNWIVCGFYCILGALNSKIRRPRNKWALLHIKRNEKLISLRMFVRTSPSHSGPLAKRCHPSYCRYARPRRLWEQANRRGERKRKSEGKLVCGLNNLKSGEIKLPVHFFFLMKMLINNCQNLILPWSNAQQWLRHLRHSTPSLPSHSLLHQHIIRVAIRLLVVGRSSRLRGKPKR